MLRTIGLGRARAVGLIPVAVLALAIAFLLVVDVGDAVFYPPYLALVLHIIFVLATSLAVAVVSARAYLRSGSPGIVLLGTALLVSGVASTASVWAMDPNLPLSLTPNGTATIGNLGSLIASLVQLIGGLAVLIGTGSNAPRFRELVLFAAYLVGLLLVLIISTAAGLDLLPIFLTGTGPTDLRIAVLTAGVILYLVSSLFFALKYLRSGSPIIYWYALGLVLLGLALVPSAFVMSMGEAMSWASRAALYLSGIYFFIAIRSQGAGREVAAPVSERWAEAFSMDGEKVAGLFDDMKSAIFYGKLVSDNKGRPIDVVLLYVNRAFEKEAGVKRVDCLGRRMTEVFSDRRYDPADWLGPYEQAAVDGVTSIYERFSPRSKRWCNISVYAHQKGRFISISEDIDDRKRGEEALKESEAKYRSLFENLQIPVNLSRNIFDQRGEVVDGVLLDANLAGLEALRATSLDEVKGKRYSELYSPHTFASSIGIVRRMYATGRPMTGEMRNDRTDRDYIMTTAPIGDDMSITFRVDITDVKRAQRALEEREEDLKNAQMVSRTGSWRLDLRSNQLLWSEETYRMFGIPEGTPMTYDIFLSAIHPDDRASVDNKWQAALQGEPYDIGHRIIANGEVRWVQEKAMLEFDEKGIIKGAFGTVQDITEHRAMENELMRSNTELQQFAYVASHDLQEPLRMVTAYLTLLEKEYGDQFDGRAKAYLDFAVEGGLRSRALIHDLLEYSRVDTQGKPFQRADMEEVLGRVLGNLSVQIKDEQAVVTHDPLPTILADDRQIAQVIQNLTNNAIKFHGEEMPRVHIAAQDKGQEWLFSVKDNAIGIDTMYKDKLFVLFQRLHTRDEYEGTGIGLALSKKIVERHGGKIWFDSEVGKGTTFYFTIPKGYRGAP